MSRREVRVRQSATASLTTMLDIRIAVAAVLALSHVHFQQASLAEADRSVLVFSLEPASNKRKHASVTLR